MTHDWTYTGSDGDRLHVNQLAEGVGVIVPTRTVYIRPQDVPAVAQALYRAAELEWPGGRTGDGDKLDELSRMVRSLTGRVDALEETEHRLKGLEK